MSEATKCYDCNSLQNPKCADPFDKNANLPTTDCPNGCQVIYIFI